MINITKLEFGNIMSYGEFNTFDIEGSVTQLIGKNGHGKSSIPVILEEGLYNKNSRGIKKSDLVNRYSGSDTYFIKVYFNVDSDEYVVDKLVGKSAKVKLSKNSEDISGHTTTQTYKMIESIIGLEFTTLSKLIYQSMVSSLDFLNATDANRKKFLISLLGLEKYAEAEKTFKEEAKRAKISLSTLVGKTETIKNWITSNSNISEDEELEEVPEFNEILEQELQHKTNEISTIDLKNKASRKALEAKLEYDRLNSLNIEELTCNEEDLLSTKATAQEDKDKVTSAKAKQSMLQSEVSKTKAIKERCHVCNSKLDVGNKKEILENAQARLDDLNKELEILSAKASESLNAFNSQLQYNKKYKSYLEYLAELKRAEAAYDSTESIEIFDLETLNQEASDLRKSIEDNRNSIALVVSENSSRMAKNAENSYKRQQLAKMELELEECSSELSHVEVLVSNLNSLVDALGNKGLIAYKIESCVKVFENLINRYLQVISDGMFALTFSVDGTKLALNVYSEGVLVDIKSLSSGEYNKVSTSTLLAIRTMLSTVAKVNINLLFLDEVVSVLDTEGKDTLIEVLLKETSLNTIVVSHGYSHPLARKLHVVKNNKISSIYKELDVF